MQVCGTTKMSLCALLLFVSFVCADDSAGDRKRFKIDAATAIVAGPTSREVICESELRRPGVDGKIPTIDQLAIQRLAYQEATRLKMPIDDAAQKHIQGLKKEHGLTEAQIDGIFQQSGRSREDGLQELVRMYAYNTLADMKVASRVVVPHEAVEKYYREHPEYDDAQIQVQVAFVPYDMRMSKFEQKTLIDQMLAEGKEQQFSWKDSVWLKEGDIADACAFIKDMDVHQISHAQDVGSGFEIFKVVATKPAELIPLERRYKEIMNILRKPLFDTYMKEYEEELRAQGLVILLDTTE